MLRATARPLAPANAYQENSRTGSTAAIPDDEGRMCGGP
jgi:hypothetical protein